MCFWLFWYLSVTKLILVVINIQRPKKFLCSFPTVYELAFGNGSRIQDAISRKWCKLVLIVQWKCYQSFEIPLLKVEWSTRVFFIFSSLRCLIYQISSCIKIFYCIISKSKNFNTLNSCNFIIECLILSELVWESTRGL